MKMYTKILAVPGIGLLVAPEVNALLFGAETTEAMVLTYAVLLPSAFMIAAIAGIITASFGDITARSKNIATFGWRPGRTHLTGKDGKKKGPSPEDKTRG